jgi:hypothetical protein
MLFGGDFWYTTILLSIIKIQFQKNNSEQKYFRTSNLFLTLNTFKTWNDFERAINVLTVPATEIHRILNTDFTVSVSMWINIVTYHIYVTHVLQ